MDDGGGTQPRQRAVLVPLLTIAAVAVALAYVQALQGLLATLAFSALAAILSRAFQRWLVGRGVGPRLALTLTVAAFVLILVLLGAAAVASMLAIAVQLSGDTDSLREQLAALSDAFAAATGLPTGSVPSVDADAVIAAARQLLSTVGPAVTSLFMSVLIVTYLLLDADNLRARMLRHTPAGVGRPLRRAGERARRVHQGAGDARGRRRGRRHDPAARPRRPVCRPVGRAVVPVQLRPQHRVHPRARPADGVRAAGARAGTRRPRRRRIRRHQPRVRLRAPAADHGHGPRHQPRRRHRRDPRLDGDHRPGRRTARGAAHPRVAGRGRAVRGRPLVRRAPRAGAGRGRGRPDARPYNRCRAGPVVVEATS